MNKLGNYLRALREERGLKLRDVEHMTGISNSFLSQVELGSRKCSTDVLLKLARAYEIPAGNLLGLNVSEDESAAEAETSVEEIDYDEAFRQLMKQQLGETAWAYAGPEYEKVPLSLKKLFVDQQLSETIRIEPSIKIVIRHSQNKFSGVIELKESDLRNAMFVREDIAIQLMYPLDTGWWDEKQGISELHKHNINFYRISGRNYIDLFDVARIQHPKNLRKPLKTRGNSGEQSVRKSGRKSNG
jgi:transcriptional regulator with XRE-family HTH domain